MEFGLSGTARNCEHITTYRHQFFLSEKPFQIQNTSGLITGNYLDGSPSMGKKIKRDEERGSGVRSKQNCICALFFSSSEQSRSVDWDVREGTNCGNVGWNEKVLETTFERRKGNFACLFGSMCTRHISLTQQRLLSESWKVPCSSLECFSKWSQELVFIESQNNKLTCVGRDHKACLMSPSAMVRDTFHYPKLPCPTYPWTLPEMGQPEFLWALWARTSPPLFSLSFCISRMSNMGTLNETWLFRQEDTQCFMKSRSFLKVSVPKYTLGVHSSKVFSVQKYCPFVPLIPINDSGLENPRGEEGGSEFQWWTLTSWVTGDLHPIIHHF